MVTMSKRPINSAVGLLLIAPRRRRRANAAGCAVAVALMASTQVSRAAGPASAAPTNQETARGRAMLWSEPAQIGGRDLFYGPGGERHQPPDSFTFLSEDLAGSHPKFAVRDADGVKWKIKLGEEARPETVASRLVWAVGYFADEDYFLADMRVANMPARLHRGQSLVGPDGTMHNGRLKREPEDRKKVGEWRWRDNQFSGTRELNGLRVLMAVLNNWDLKDVNTACHLQTDGDQSVVQEVCEVSDLGATFGSTGLELTNAESEGNLHAYAHSPFITKETSDYVDFAVPGRAAWIVLFNPREYFMRLRLRWIGRQIPREDAKWIGHLLAELSPQQLREAFRAAGYSPEQIDGFTSVLRSRIAQLNEL